MKPAGECHDSTLPRSSLGLSPRADVEKQLSPLEGQPTPPRRVELQQRASAM